MPTKLPLRPSLLKIRRQTVKWIIVHDTAESRAPSTTVGDIDADAPERGSGQPQVSIDNPIYQFRFLSNDVMERKTIDYNYHYIIEQIKEDFVPIVARPISYLCTWKDIPTDINGRAIHVAVLGNYNFKVPEKRLYEILAYRILNPMIKLFGISPQKVKFHREVSTDPDCACPGDFMQKAITIAMMRKYVVM